MSIVYFLYIIQVAEQLQQGPAVSERTTLLPDRRRFLRRAAAAELAALHTADPQQKRAWTDIARAWAELAQEIVPPSSPLP